MNIGSTPKRVLLVLNCAATFGASAWATSLHAAPVSRTAADCSNTECEPAHDHCTYAQGYECYLQWDGCWGFLRC
jgi:hypothetical protein